MAQNLTTKHIIEAIVKPTLDKSEREKLNADLGRIFADASNIDFNTKETRESLNNLAKAFQAIFDKIGDKSIDFDKLIKMPAPDTFAKLGEIASKQFWDAWNSVASGMTAGTSKEMLREQFKQLEKQRTELVKKKKILPEKKERLDDLSQVPYMDMDEFHTFSKGELKKFGKSIDDIAIDMLDSLTRKFDKLGDLKGGTPEFTEALEQVYEQMHDVFRMSHTLAKHPDLVKDKTLLQDYDFEALQDEYAQDLSQYEIALSNILSSIDKELALIPVELKKIDTQLIELKNHGVEIVDQDSARSGLKTLNEIEEAYKGILNSKKINGEYRANQKEIEKIQSALDFNPSQSKQGIKSLYEEYQAAAASGSWEEEYKALLKYVRLYEEYRKGENKTHRNKVTKPGNEFTPLYEELKPMVKNAENMLRNIVNMAENKPLVGMGGAGDGTGTGSGTSVTPEDVANAEKIAELERQTRIEAEAKAKTEREAVEAAKQKRIEEERAAKAAEKKRLTVEAVAEAGRKAAEEAEREKVAKEATHKLNTYTGYRAVEPPSGSGKTKEDALSDWGGEYFSTDKDVAASYGENFFEKGNIVIGKITPKNPLTINANGLRWDEFDKMPGVKEMFPEILELMKQPRYTGDDGQKYINEQAKLAGYDAVVLENVQDALDGDIKEYKLSTTIAVLDDKIISLTGSMAQLEAGTNRFADVISAEIPSYYVRSTEDNQLQPKNIAQGSDGGTGAGDASSAELEAERVKREALQDEIEQKNRELAQIQQESDAKLKAASNEKNTLQNDLDNTRQQLADVEYEKGLYDSAMHKIEEESNAKDRIIYELREQLANVKTSDTKQAPWALESTLQAVKGVLDSIHTNTVKTESVEVTPVSTDVGNVLATENTLAAIKAVIETINTKVVKGTKTTASNSNQTPKQETGVLTPYVADDDSNSTSTKSNDKSMKLLADISLQRKNLEKFIVQLQTAGKLTDEYQIWIDNLTKLLDEITSTDDMTIWKKVFARTKTSVGIDDVVGKNAKQMTQREAMLGKAGNAVGRAENTWMNAVGIEGEMPAGFVAEIDEYYKQLDALRKKHQELKNSNMISEDQKKDLIAQTISVNKMTAEIGELISEYQKLSGDNATVIGTNTLNSDAELGAYEQQLKQAVNTATNGKAQIKNFDAATKTLTYTVKTGKNEFTEYTAVVRHLDGQLVSVQGTTKRTETFFEATARKMKELTSYFSGMAIFNFFKQELSRGIQYVREIDLALTELRKVTDETEETYDEFLKTAAKTGEKLGATISAVTEATATFAKLGYTIEQATEMAEAAIVYKNVGDNIASTEDAADSIISTLKGFGLEASEAMAIVDRFNEVGNKFAITSQGIGEALRLSASALNEGGNSLDESIGLITAANEVVNDPSSVGTALKTLTLRLRGSKTE